MGSLAKKPQRRETINEWNFSGQRQEKSKGKELNQEGCDACCGHFPWFCVIIRSYFKEAILGGCLEH